MLRRDVTGTSPALLMLLFLAATNLAAGDRFDSDQPVPLQDMQVTATGTERLSYDVAQAVTTVDREVIDRESPQVIPEVLRGGIGTFFQQTTPGQGSAIIRGLKGSQILHLVDGMRLNNAFFRSAPNQYLALVDPYAVARTEVIRGTAATLYGADAMGGVIQLLTPESQFDGSEWSIESSAYAAYEHADRGRILRAEGAAGRHGFAVSGGVTWQDYDDRRTGSERIDRSGYDSTAADGKLLFDLGDNADVMLSAQYHEQPNTPRVDELIAGFGQDEPSSELFAFRPNQREFYHARLRMTPELSWLDNIEAHLGRQDITDDRKTRNFGSTITIDESNKSERTGLIIQFDFCFRPGASAFRTRLPLLCGRGQTIPKRLLLTGPICSASLGPSGAYGVVWPACVQLFKAIVDHAKIQPPAEHVGGQIVACRRRFKGHAVLAELREPC